MNCPQATCRVTPERTSTDGLLNGQELRFMTTRSHARADVGTPASKTPRTNLLRGRLEGIQTGELILVDTNVSTQYSWLTSSWTISNHYSCWVFSTHRRFAPIGLIGSTTSEQPFPRSRARTLKSFLYRRAQNQKFKARFVELARN